MHRVEGAITTCAGLTLVVAILGYIQLVFMYFWFLHAALPCMLSTAHSSVCWNCYLSHVAIFLLVYFTSIGFGLFDNQVSEIRTCILVSFYFSDLFSLWNNYFNLCESTNKLFKILNFTSRLQFLSQAAKKVFLNLSWTFKIQ